MDTKPQIDDLKKALTTEIPKLLETKQVEGVSLALIQDQNMILKMGFGLRNSVIGDSIMPQSMFEAYSLTKPLVAYRALDLNQKGILDLNRPLDDYMNTPCVYNDHRSKFITARTVLCHTSGLPDDETEKHITFTPGEQWSYSTQGYCCLQHVINQISAEPFDENMKRHLLDPFSMASSSFVWEDRFTYFMAQGHNAQGNPETDRKITVADADSLLTTASDYAMFVVKCLWPNQSHDSESSHHPSMQMIQPQVKISENLYWGLGWGVEETDNGSFIWHIGGGMGAPFQNFVLASRHHGLGVVILTNSANGGYLFEPIVSHIIGKKFTVFKFIQDYFY